jgi:hypothetical protein
VFIASKFGRLITVLSVENMTPDMTIMGCHYMLVYLQQASHYIYVDGSCSEIDLQYTPSVSTIILSGRTYSSQNVRQMSDKFESQHSLSPTIWSDIVVGSESGYLKIFFYISRGEHVKHFVIDAYL